jgi:adenine-specific DNA methylase
MSRPKLIEVTLPLEEINKHSVRENYTAATPLRCTSGGRNDR